jgi:deoxyribodipyrimidine photolyase-related protein
MPRHLVLVLGDQLDRRSAAFDGFDPSRDMIWMAEVAGESTHVWSAKPRIVMFLAAMRHFRDRLVAEGLPVDYHELAATAAPNEPTTLAAALERSLAALAQDPPQAIVVVEPGEHRVRQDLVAAAKRAGIPLEIRTDRHFFSSVSNGSIGRCGRSMACSWRMVSPREEPGTTMPKTAAPFPKRARGSFPPRAASPPMRSPEA